MQRVHNPFWQDVMKHFKNKYIEKCSSSNVDEFTSECIYYNVHIVREKSIILAKEWLKNNTILMRHIVELSGIVCSLMNLRENFQLLQRPTSRYMKVLSKPARGIRGPFVIKASQGYQRTVCYQSQPGVSEDRLLSKPARGIRGPFVIKASQGYQRTVCYQTAFCAC